jgi:hypothetical protein
LRSFCTVCALHAVHDHADNRGDDRPGNAAADQLAEPGADVGAACCVVKHWNERSQQRPASDPANRARDSIARVPKFTFFAAAPTALPPIAPAMSWMMRLMIVPDMHSSVVAAISHGSRGNRLPSDRSSCLVFALFRSQVNHRAAASGTRLRDFAIEISPPANYRQSTRKIICAS